MAATAESLDSLVRMDPDKETLYDALKRINAEGQVLRWCARAAGVADFYFEDASQEARIAWWQQACRKDASNGEIVNFAKTIGKQRFMDMRALIGGPVSIPREQRGTARLICEPIDSYTEQAMGLEDLNFNFERDHSDHERELLFGNPLERLSEEELEEGLERLESLDGALADLARNIISGESFESANDRAGYQKDTARRYRQRIEDALNAGF